MTTRPLLLLLALLACVALSASPTRAQETVTVYADSTAQTIRGFGAANILPWRPDMTDAEFETAFGTGDGQLGFSVLRIKIDPTPDTWARNVPTAKKAFDRGVLVFASPWNAPDDLLIPGVEGDTVAADKYGEYAAHLVAFDDFMADNGVDLYAISVQNEPDYAETWTGWSPEGMVTFLADHADAIDTRVIAPESFQFRREITDPILNDPAAAANVDIIGGHTYGAGLQPYPLALEKGKELWMTEHYTDSQHSAQAWPLALDVARDVHGTMLSGMSAYVWWYIVRYYGPIGDGEAPASFPDEPVAAKGEVTKRGHLMAQFSRFIRPGYVRVYTTQPSPFAQLSVSAYRGDSRLVVVVLNTGSTPREVVMPILGGSAASFERYVTDETRDVARLDDVPVTDGALTATLGPFSTTTFVAEARNVAVEDEPSASPTLAPARPNPFGAGTTLAFTLPTAGPVTLTVFDALGREVAALVDGARVAGAHEVTFDASALPAGVYTARLVAGDHVAHRRMTLLR